MSERSFMVGAKRYFEAIFLCSAILFTPWATWITIVILN